MKMQKIILSLLIVMLILSAVTPIRNLSNGMFQPDDLIDVSGYLILLICTLLAYLTKKSEKE